MVFNPCGDERPCIRDVPYFDSSLPKTYDTCEKVCSEQFQIEGFEDKNGSIQNIGGLAGLALSGTKTNEVRYPEISDINRLGIYDDIIKITEQEIKNYKTIPIYTGVNPKFVFPNLPSLGGNTTSFSQKESSI